MQAYTVRCTSCGTLNRVPVERMGDTGRCGECGGLLPGDPAAGRPMDVTDSDFHDAVIGSPVPVLLEFWAPTCGHCVRMHPVMDEIASALKGRLRVAKMDVNANQRTPFDYNIRGTPAFLLIKDGKVAESFVGAMPGQEIMKRLERHLR